MRRVALQPAGNRHAREHYKDTVESPVDLASHADLLAPSDFQALQALYADGAAPVWGATPGKNGVNVPKFEKMSEGDVVLFASKGRVFRAGTVTRKIHNEPLAERLWKRDVEGRTWELIFFLAELRHLDISYAEFNQVAGYEPNNVIQNFYVLNEEKSAALFEYLSLDSDTYPAVPTQTEVQQRLAALNGATEKAISATQRLEQGLLRASILPGPSGECAICGRTFPSRFLIAAHIKKRSECTTQERLDIPTIAMLACKFGCDSLYEDGLIAVDDQGKISVSEQVGNVLAVHDYLASLAGRACSAFNEDSAKYFDWHRTHTFRMT